MTEIKTNQELEVNKILSFRGKIRQTELDQINKDMETKIQESGAKLEGKPIIATFGIEGEYIDVEVLMPVDQEIKATGKYRYKNKIKIINAVKVCYKGHPVGLQAACNEMNQYIVDNSLQPITVGYNVTKNVDLTNLENTEIDIYVGINPNVV